MIFTADGFTLLVKSLGLIQGLSKPSPASLLAVDDTVTPQSTDGFGQSSDTIFTFPVDAQSNPDPDGSDDDMWSLNDSDDPCQVKTYLSAIVAAEPFPAYERTTAHIYRYRQQQSVNLGSWFVHEQWMTPSLFTCASGKKISEHDIASGWGSTASARSVLERHWDTFITESDFQYLASIGINTVRLPIGYWSLGPVFCAGTPFEQFADVYRTSWAHVVHAINMAGGAGIGVLVDLHGAPGSQNGQPHSGISDGATNLFNEPADQDKTVSVLTFLVQQLSSVNNVVGIQMLNEPKNVPQLADFYTRAITAMRQSSSEASSFPLYLHDGFDLNRFSEFIAARTDFVVQDYHSYYVFTPSDDAESAHGHTADIEGSIAGSLAKASKAERRNLVIDEWSCALTSESLSQESDPEESRRQFCTGQMDVYTNVSAGWAFWAYKKEQCQDDPGWCFKAAVGRSLPQSFFSYGQQQMSHGQSEDVASIVAGMSTPSNDTSPAEDVQGASEAFDLQPAYPPPALLRRRADADASEFGPAAQDTADTDEPRHRSSGTGYSDGFLTAKIFATHDNSRLGFVGQYIVDTMAARGSTEVAPGTEDAYKGGFMKGLHDGETIVRGILLT
ncbi:glycoside hydrolase family 5 protein [Auriscalpium vulgare]|uniref:Glycoside hydrolase family 5 protein n=1 Tax=Auriscalpium vulgare TaxID=40419 RepID=A0ACB8SDK7_9AGAM|nr:glycoside hydrolase family 5 protein [Auriscalpium vulgare]